VRFGKATVVDQFPETAGELVGSFPPVESRGELGREGSPLGRHSQSLCTKERGDKDNRMKSGVARERTVILCRWNGLHYRGAWGGCDKGVCRVKYGGGRRKRRVLERRI